MDIDENVTATIIIIPLPTHYHYCFYHIAQPLWIIIIIFSLP